MSALAQAIGAFAIGYIADRFGRKWPACAAGALTIVGTAVQYYSHARGILLVGKMINGLGIGAAMAIAPLKLRGPVQQGLVLFFVFTLGLGLGVVRIFVPDLHEQAFRNVFAIQWAVGGIAVLAFVLTPESPNWLITKGKLTQAHKVMGMIYGKENSVNARLVYLARTIREEQANNELHSGTYFECFKGIDLRRTLTVVFIYSAVNWGGAAFLSQSIYFLIIAGLAPTHAFDVSINGFGLAMIIIVISWIIGDKIRKRDGFLVGNIINFSMMLTIGSLYYAPGTGPLWGIAVLMSVLIALQTSLIQSMGYPIAAEISSYKLRAKTLSISIISNTFSNWLTAFTVPHIYNVDSGNLGTRMGFVFAAMSLAYHWYLVRHSRDDWLDDG